MPGGTERQRRPAPPVVQSLLEPRRLTSSPPQIRYDELPGMLIHLLIVLSLVALVGCKPAGGGGGTPAAPAAPPALLQPFQGNWRFSPAKTLAQWPTASPPPRLRRRN